VDADELAGEVGSVQPGLGDDEIGGGFEAVRANVIEGIRK
jgi:hypothetical protein